MSAFLAFAAAFANALNVVAQHVASTGAPPSERGVRLALYLVRNPLWLLGAAATLAAFALQSAALYEGRVSVVQTVLVSEVVFSLVIGRVWLHRSVRNAAWLSALLVCGGLSLFLVMAEPHGGRSTPAPGTRLPALIAVTIAVVVLTLGAASGSPRRRGALYAAGSAVAWATMATLLKSSTDVVATDGVSALLTHPAFYGVIVSGAVGTVLAQAALNHGPLATSQPIMVAVDPVVSIALSVWVYQERFSHAPGRVMFGSLGFVVLVLGIVLLSRNAPSFEAHPETSADAPT
jgi:drug/metabolite transporter (DMT)-like permease